MGNLSEVGTEFQVTPRELMHSAQIMCCAAEKSQKEQEKLFASFQKLESCFQGNAKMMLMKKAAVLKAEWQELLSGLHNSALDLQEVALNYEKAEGENVSAIMENDC